VTSTIDIARRDDIVSMDIMMAQSNAVYPAILRAVFPVLDVALLAYT
jgi:hypothetical protein